MNKKIKAYIFDELGQAKVYELNSIHNMLKMDYILSKQGKNVTFLYGDKRLYINDNLDFIDNEKIIKEYIDSIDKKEILRNSMGSASSKDIDFNKISEEWRDINGRVN